MTTPRNVVLICVDQWRGDCLSAEGHPVLHTPHLDQLAQRGTRFRRAYSATPTCVPARIALMTGLSQSSSGRVGYQDGVPFDFPVTMPGEFRRSGYQTYAIGKLHVYPERSRIGFDDVLLHDGYLHFARKRRRDFAEIDDYLPWLRAQAGENLYSDYVDNGLNCNSMIARPWDKPEALHPSTWVVTSAISWLYRRDPTRPFFLYLSFHRPHPPFDPPGWAYEQYLDAEPYDPPVGDWVDDYAAFAEDGKHDARVGQMRPDVLRRARAGYYGHMAHIDLQVNRFLEALAEFGLKQDTVVGFISDHGEMLGEHHMFRKGYPYEGSARVPFLLAGPGVPAGAVRDDIVELRDVMPTLLEAVGIDPPKGLDGRNVLAGPVREHLHGEHALFGQSLQWITDAAFKYCWLSATGREHLFDLRSDPNETRNVAADPRYTADLHRLRGLLIAHLTHREEGYVAEGRLVPGRPAVTVLRRPPGPMGSARRSARPAGAPVGRA